MCGIFGYAGPDANPEILVEGIKRLEYRGYDSWGLCVASNDQLAVLRRVGRLGGVDAGSLPLNGNGAPRAGMAHTRWATTRRTSGSKTVSPVWAEFGCPSFLLGARYPWSNPRTKISSHVLA